MFLPGNESGKSGTLCEGSRPIRLAGSTLGHRAHICAFFNGTQEAYRVLLPYIKEGLERGEKAVHTIDPRLRDEHIGHNLTLEEVERKHILATLKQNGWVISGPKGAAIRLGLNRSTLHFRMKKLGIFRSLNASLD